MPENAESGNKKTIHARQGRESLGSGQGRDRTGDTCIFSAVLYQLSYLTVGHCKLRVETEYSRMIANGCQFATLARFFGVFLGHLWRKPIVVRF